jgi:signal transduction histidine kinase
VLAERVALTSGLAIDLDVDLDYEAGRAATRHTPELESTMYRLVQEALTNVVKHAGAERVHVAIVERDGTVDVTVRDDGAGFDTDERSEGFGLIGMRERVALAGGALEITSHPGDGATIAAHLPVRRLDDAGRAEPARRSGAA